MIGGCDIYTTKAAGGDKKLYKNIESSLESQHASLVRLSASLSPPEGSSTATSLNLSRSSPFGPLSQISSRRTFAYLIATLNASHPDYDFSHILRPTDFRRERSLKSVMNTIDTTLYNLRPKPANSLLAVPSRWSNESPTDDPPTPGGSQTWSPKMWTMIDKEMALRECSIYCYSPEEDPYDGEEGAIWSFSYFFFNKTKKRVCYLYLRGLSIISHSPAERTLLSTPGRSKYDRDSSTSARKRARYWLGDRADDVGDWAEDDEDMDENGTHSKYVYEYEYDEDEEDLELVERRKNEIRGISEDIAASMDV